MAAESIYPSLQIIAQLFRFFINDTLAGATNTVGEGHIMTNTNPDLLTLMNASIRDLYADLRNIGDPTLIKDNYVLTGLPVISGPQGSATPSPETQVSLGYSGFYDGTTIYAGFTLPIDCVMPLRLWERPSGSGAEFIPMSLATDGLCPSTQGNVLGEWEWRGDAIWMHGSLVSADLRMRYAATFPDFFGTAIDFTSTYVPIVNAQNAIAAKMLTLYAVRMSPAMMDAAESMQSKYTLKLKNEVQRGTQASVNARSEFGASAGISYLTQL